MDNPLLSEYESILSARNPGTAGVYRRALYQFIAWLASRPGSQGRFEPGDFTRTAVETYLAHLEAGGYSINSRHLAKAALSGFARWLMEDKELIRRNPTRGITLPAEQLMAPRVLSDDQRYVLRNLVERQEDPRASALFSLGYWAGCRVSDVSWLKMAETRVTQRTGQIVVGYKGGKLRRIDLCPQARTALGDYLESQQQSDRLYVFSSQRSGRLTEAGIHHWFRQLKAQARQGEWELVQDVSFHDLRHDFAHRAREAGWTLEEIAFYLGHTTRKGTPAIQTTARYTQVGHEQLQAKLTLIRG